MGRPLFAAFWVLMALQMPLAANPAIPVISGLSDLENSAADDLVDWDQLGSSGSRFTSPEPIRVNDELTISLPNAMERIDALEGWDELWNFNSGLHLLRTINESMAVMVINFSKSVLAAGLHIESELPGGF